MRIFGKHRSRLAVLVVPILLAGTVYGFTASISGIGTKKAGSGQGTISGYAVTSGPSYTLNASDPTQITASVFTLDAAATTVKAKISGGSWVSCSATANPNEWTCPTTSSVSAATSLDIVATN